MNDVSEKYLVVGTDGTMTAPVSEEAGPWWKTTKQRLVRAFFPSTLKSGTQVKFQDGTIYQTSPLKQWRNKAQHKAYKRKRMLQRRFGCPWRDGLCMACKAKKEVGL